MDIIFDMETGDPDDLITLLLLLKNPIVNLKGVTCHEGSPIQIGLIQNVLIRAGRNIPVGGWNTETPKELSPYYKETVGSWVHQTAIYTPVEVFEQNLTPNTHVLTGGPLTNIQVILNEIPNIKINNMVTQGGYLGNLVKEVLPKFQGVKENRTYNLTSQVNAFTAINFAENIRKLTYVTKDLCHGFVYTPEIHKNNKFSDDPIGKLLKTCLEKYAMAGKGKAMHDPLAMLFLLYPEIGTATKIEMNYRMNSQGHAVFSSVEGGRNRYGLTDYDKSKAWQLFTNICGLKYKK